MREDNVFAKVSGCLLSVLLSWNGMGPDATGRVAAGEDKPFKPDWASLRTHTIPQWLREGKFGIYTHWGIYSVPAIGAERHLVCQHGLLGTSFSRTEIPGADLRPAGEIRLQGLYPHVYRREV